MSPQNGPAASRRSLAVLLASSERGFYGGESQALLLARGLGDLGHRPVILARRDGALLPRALAAGVEAVAWAPGHSPRRLLATRRQLRGLSPDVLHCNDPRALTAAAGVAVGLDLGARIASRRVSFPPRSPFAYRRLADAVVCVSADVRRVCLEAGLPGTLLHVVHDGVDPLPIRAADPERARASLALPPQARVLLVVASLNECKGHGVLLEAVEPLLAARQDLHLVLAGAGPLRQELARRAAASPAADRIHLPGYRDDVPDLLRAADVFVLPSLQEGLGTALLEAMLAGLPCVASNVGGIGEALGPDGGQPGCGWLVPPGQPEPLRAAIQEALTDADEAALRARRARRRAGDRFTAERMVAETVDVYRRVLQRR